MSDIDRLRDDYERAVRLGLAPRFDAAEVGTLFAEIDRLRAQVAALSAPAEPEEQTFDRMGWINEAMRLAFHYREASTAAANAPYLALLDHLKTAGMHWRAFTFLRDKEAKEAAAPAPAETVASDPLYDDAYLRGVALGFPQGDSRRWTLCRIADRIEAAAAFAAPAAPAGWQPIETAPDGAMLLFADMKAAEARWWAFCGWRHSGLRGNSVQMPDNTARSATHWMPIPAAPGAQGDA